MFTTPQPPEGSFLFAVALGADMHLGETVAGLATTQAGVQLPPGIMQREGPPPYTEVMAAALGTETRQRGAHMLVAVGDLTAEAEGKEAADAKKYLDTFGQHGRDYLVTRGNHDRPHSGDKWKACRPVAGQAGYHDCFRDVFFGTGPAWFSQERFGMRVLGLDTYDKIGDGGDNGVMSEQQFAFVRDELRRDPDRPTLVVGHHPVTIESTIVNISPIRFDLEPAQAQALQELYVAAPGVFLNGAGHTHRNKRTISTVSPDVTFQELGAAKEYPGGFTLLRMFTGGFALNFYPFRGDAGARVDRALPPAVLRAEPDVHVRYARRPQHGRRPRLLGPHRGQPRSRRHRRAAASPRRQHPGARCRRPDRRTSPRAAPGVAAAALAAVAAERWLRRRKSSA